MKELTVKDLIELLETFEPDAIPLIPSGETEEKKYGYNFATVTEAVDEIESQHSKLFKNFDKVRVLTKDGEVVPHLKLRGAGRRFVVLQ